MTLLEFIDLTDEEQTDLLYAIGDHVDTAYTFDAEYQLFSLWTFFVEMTLDPEGMSIQRISPFQGGERLNKYTKDIKPKPKPWD